MLKALELVGFKSFADKTRFEFPPGITVVVGPNGSGKSNIVDAIKWVLGEQSAKSLRGKDMADVIFKGSGSGRRVMNTAEATIIFDNSEGRLAVDAPEVHVTRRVYRSGEGEYLINRQPCRLRDIRDMFRGTGVGTDAYSLIEQGKVDRMLQASSKDRRHIFEEAAGISRFKAKKIEAQRRLERVENNLVRLSDIVDEVESRLRSIRSQASKARRYREYSDRLQQLRTQVGWSDWRRLTNQLHEAEAELQAIQSESQERSQEAAGVQQQIENISARLQAGTRQVHDTETRLGRLREAITAGETETKHGFDRCREWEQDVHSFRSRLLATSLRAGELEGRLADARGQLADARARFDEASGRVTAQEQIVQQLAEKTQELREENKSHRLTYMEQVREATILTTQVGNLKRQIEDDAVVVNRSDERLASMNADFQRLHDELASAEQSLEQLDGQLRENRSLIEAGEIELAETRQILDRRQKEITIYRARLSGKQERAALLAEMEHRREGIGRGVRELLEKAEQGRDGFADVCGLLADLVQAKVESAPLIDALLGPSAQFVVVKGVDLIDALAARKLTLTGRVGLVPLTVARTATETPGLPTPGLPTPDGKPAPRTAVGTAASGVQEMDGVIGPADDLFECEPVYRPLIQRFLADAWVVRDLATAVSLRRGGFNARFVTLAAEVIEVDGTLVVGDEAAGDGLISRRSELNALAQEIGVIERQIEREEKELQRLEENIDRQQRRIRQLTNQQRELSSERAEQRVIVNTLVQTGQSLEKQIDTLRRERDAASDRGSRSDGELRESENRLIELDELNKRHEGQIEVNEQQLKSLDERRQKESHAATSARVAFARCQEEVAALEGQVAQFEEDHRERSRAVGEVREQLRHAQERIEKTERLLLETSARLSGQFLEKDARTAEIAELAFQQLDDEQQRVELTGQRESLEQRVRRLESKYHKQELAAGEVRHQRATLAERLRDDYGIDIEAHDAESGEANEEEQQQREQIDDEIASLRRKISNIGAVNMEALHELDDLEERFNSLSGQYQDLTQAKDALLRIISRINADSRRLFMETLEAIRANFQVLYRHAFGGGNADLVMEEGADPLEAGVEIIATPPGKPSFNNSLLSGGEKALTAVSLLLAIFQFRPSPFCVLDEVNAPFDEANIGRFVDVLKGFLGWTKFVIVTHSKKTMTAAHTLYGVTMQESGVSKQVSVSFEDVSEDGHISPDAIKRAERSTQDDAA